MEISPTTTHAKYPALPSETVYQYGADYIQLLPEGKEVTFTFDGSDMVRVIPTDPPSGQSMWWGGRNVEDARLTREVDLSGVNKATLKFRAWYDVYDDWDYGYMAVSLDGGKTWQPLKGQTTTGRDPNAWNFGNGLICKSGVGCGQPEALAQWVKEEMDLTPYAGQKILLGFRQIAGSITSGLAFDDIEIPEIGFKDDAEVADPGWRAEGFARMDNILPQRFILQVIEHGATPRVVQIQLDAQNRGTYPTYGFGQEISRVVIVVSGSTSVTWEKAEYMCEIR